MNRSALSVTGIVLAAILFVAVNVFANNAFQSSRLDLTESHLFTLSDGSINVIKSVEEPIRLRFYFSKGLAGEIPTVARYGQRVQEMLEEFVSASGGNIRLEVIDPEPFTDAEDDAVRAGLQALPLPGGDSLYFGLIGTNTTDDREVVPFFSQEKEQFLEYDLTRLVYTLTDPKKPVVGLITGQQMNADVSPLQRLSGRGPEPWAIVDLIRQSFDLKTVNPESGRIDDDIDVLLVVHPPKLSDKALFAIDQYVLRGGRAVVMVDPHSEVAAQTSRPGMPGQSAAGARSELEKLLNAWGASVDPDKVIGDFAFAQQVNAGYPGRPKIMRYLPWLELNSASYNPEDVITSQLGPMAIVSAGSVEPVEGATTTLTPLVQSSDQSMLMNAEEVRFGPQPQRLIEIFKADGKHHAIAARLTGPVKSAFPDGPPKDKAATADDGKADGKAAEKQAEPAFLAESSQPINVVVVADSDMLFDQLWLNQQSLMGQNVKVPVAANGDFLINTLDNLAGSNDLISLRSRGKSARPFLVVEELRRDAEQQFLNQEQELKKKLEKTQERIGELESRASGGGGNLLSAEQQVAIAEARTEILNTRKQLRDVQHNLNRDIEVLEARLKFANIGLIPIVVALFAVVLAGLRYQRRRRRAQSARS